MTNYTVIVGYTSSEASHFLSATSEPVPVETGTWTLEDSHQFFDMENAIFVEVATEDAPTESVQGGAGLFAFAATFHWPVAGTHVKFIVKDGAANPSFPGTGWVTEGAPYDLWSKAYWLPLDDNWGCDRPAKTYFNMDNIASVSYQALSTYQHNGGRGRRHNL